MTQNLWANKNLFNGQVGTVKDFLYPEGKTQPSIPVAVIIDFPDYKGPPFFTNPGQETWVPIMARTHTWGKFRNKFRTQIPITLGWGWTFWKVQGSTFICPVVCHLGDKEVEHGLTFVGVSRAKTIAMLAVPQGVSYERLTTEITKGKNFKDRKVEEARLKQLMDVCLRNYELHPEKYQNLHIEQPMDI